MKRHGTSPLELGAFAETSRVFDRDDLTDLRALTGAPDTGTLVPETLINSLFSYLLGVDLPGQGTNYLKQETRFHRTVEIGTALTARVEISRLRPENHLVDLTTTCRTMSGELIADGRALALARDVAGAFD